MPLHAYGLRPDLFAVTYVLSDGPGGPLAAYAKGAVEAIAELCRLSAEEMPAIHAQVDALAQSGVRVLGVAKTASLAVKSPEDLPDTPRGLDFKYLGLIGFADPLRATVPAAVAESRRRGRCEARHFRSILHATSTLSLRHRHSHYRV
jgi:Ca2+-transporting ATPase